MRLVSVLIILMTLGVLATVFLGLPQSEAEEGKSAKTALPEELGRVAWLRDYPAALQKAKTERKPVMLLFDEVPGCSTCKQFGVNPLSHPILVDAAEEFIPIAIYNNVGGKDAEVLKKFNEPAWNNPVVRFLQTDERDLIPRKDGVYDTGEILHRMVLALEKAERKVPEYLRLVHFEYNPKARETATFAMYCYWEGERKLGSLDGVLATRIGSLQGAEVVEVEFDSTVLGYRKLVEAAKEMDCTHRVFARSDKQLEIAKAVVGNKAVRSDTVIDDRTTQQYHLAHYPHYHYLPLTALQATKVNALLAAEKSPDAILSPGQLKQVKLIGDRLKQSPKAMANLKPERTPKGINTYAVALERQLAK